MFKNFTPTACSNQVMGSQPVTLRRALQRQHAEAGTNDQRQRRLRTNKEGKHDDLFYILHSTSNTSLTFQSLLLYVTTIEWTTMVQNWSGLPRRIYWHLWAVHFTTRLHTKLKFYEMPPPHLPLKSQELVSLIWLPLHHHTMRSLHTMQLNYQRRRDG